MISVVVPVKDGGEDLVRCLEGIRAQLLDDEVEVVVIDSGSSDGSVARARALGAVVHQIDPREFDHGATRNLGAAMARGEVLVFTSQDAHAEDEHWLARLVAPLRGDESLAGVYGRQLAHPAARPAEQWFLDFLYGPRSRTQRLQDGDQRGVSMETTLFSNANSAIRRAVWERFPFAENVIMSEDQEWSRRVLLAGHALRYEAQAVVRHSHDYSLAAAFRRFFDSGVSASRSYMGGAAAGGALRRRILAYGRGELSWLVRKGHVRAIPQTIVYELAKLAGLVLGLNHERLPARLRPRLSALPGYWEREAGAGDRQGECRICGAALGPARLRGRDRLLGEPGEFSVHECPRCGVAATLPRLGAHEVARFYPERYQPHGAPTGRLAGVLALARRLQLDLRLRRRPFSAILAGGPGRVLDVGCGRGELASAFVRRGWHAAGVEPVAGAAAAARAAGIDARAGTLADAQDRWERGSFDAVVFFTSLEHVQDPLADLRSAARLLAPGGHVLVVVQDWGSRHRRLFGSAWYHLDLPRHVHHFSAHALEHTATQAGFEGCRSETIVSLAGLAASIQYALFGRCLFRGPALWVALCALVALYPLTWLACRAFGLGGDLLVLHARRGADPVRGS